MAKRRGLAGLILQEVEERAGVAIISRDQQRIQEQAVTDLRATWRELDLLGYSILDYFSGNPSDVRPETRRTMAKESLTLWMTDVQMYRATELLIDFAFGRGIPKPRAKSAAVQRVLDQFWDDPVNKALVSTAKGQRKLARDLVIQSNVFPLVFSGGDDGKVQVSLLAHDAVQNAVRDNENRMLVLYYTAKPPSVKWDYDKDRYVKDTAREVSQKVTYYEEWQNVKALEEDGKDIDKPPSDRTGDGKVFHLVENVTGEMVFGVPMAQRTLKWVTSYGEFMGARVDMMRAAAAFIMKRKIKGTPTQLMKMATRAVSRDSPLYSGVDSGGYPRAGRAGAIINENENVDHEPLKLDTGSAQAAQDADALHGQIAAGTGLPKHYLGSSDANLATATAMELFVIKRVESFQEIFESFYRALFDLAIERAVETGKLDEYEQEEAEKNAPDEIFTDEYDRFMADLQQREGVSEEALEAVRATYLRLREDYEDQGQDEAMLDRDLSYEFSMPSPLRRMMGDLVTAAQGVAQTFDPNNTNVELSRALLAIVFGEAFEVDDPAALVERILPPGYVDPMIAAAMEQGGGGAGGAAPGGGGAATSPPPPGQDSGAADQPAGAGSRYGAPMQATPPEAVPGAQEATLVLERRDGERRLVPLRMTETTTKQDEIVGVTVKGHAIGLDALYDQEVTRLAAEELERAAHASTNGSSNGDGDG